MSVSTGMCDDGHRKLACRVRVPQPALRTDRLPAALTQGLRDFFGAHTYGRIDEDRDKKFHTQWSGDRSESPA